jgi:hypothetical protein
LIHDRRHSKLRSFAAFAFVVAIGTGAFAGCVEVSGEVRDEESSLSVGVTVPDRLAATLTSLRLDVFDELADCDGSVP